MKSQSFHDIRTGRFTSSAIVNLIGNGRKSGELSTSFYASCKRVAAERMLGAKCLTGGSIATDWGSVVEHYVVDLIKTSPDEFDQNYSFGYSDSPICHPDEELGKWWCGTPDGRGKLNDTTPEIKCPFSVEKFFELLGITAEQLKDKANGHEEKYWQLVSNCILTGTKYGELIVFFPTKFDVERIKEMNEIIDNGSFRLAYKDIDELPHLRDDMAEHSLYRLRFEIPQEDKDFLTERVKMAIEEVKRIMKEKLEVLANK